MSLNKVMLIGNVGKDPEIRYIDNGGAKVASFTLATSERTRDRNGETKENTEWHNIVAWRNTADIVERYVKKGTQLYIEGRLRTRSWDDKSGAKRYTTEIIADSLQLLGRKADNPASDYAASGAQGAPYSQSAGPSYAQPTGSYTQPAAQTRPGYQAQEQAYQQAAPQAPAGGSAFDTNSDDSDDLPF